METIDKQQAKKDLKYIADHLRKAYERIQEIYEGLNDED